MAAPKYTLQNDPETGNDFITLIFSDGDVQVVTSKQPNYQGVFNALFVEHSDEAIVRDLANPAALAGRELTALSERVRYADGTIFFDNDVINSALSRHIVRIIEEGGTADQYGYLVKFMEKLHQNPNPESIESLYSFLELHNIAIMPDGDFIAYKGVNADGTSRHAGTGIVNGKEYKHAHLPNPIRAVVEIPRSLVDADTAHGCSTGLHAGTHRYAKAFANGLLLTVKINPRDVVSVPKHSNFEKIRTSRYVVLETTEQEITSTTYSARADNDFKADKDQPKQGKKSKKKGKKNKAKKQEQAKSIGKQLREFRENSVARNYQKYPLTKAEYNLLQQVKVNGSYSGLLSESERAAVKDYDADAERDAEILKYLKDPADRWLQFIDENDSEYNRRMIRSLAAFRAERSANWRILSPLTVEEAALLETVSELNWDFPDVMALSTPERQVLRQFKAAGLRTAGEERAADAAKAQAQPEEEYAAWELELWATVSPKELTPAQNRQVQAYLRKTYGVEADTNKPSAEDFRKQLVNEFASEEEIVLDFYYDSPNSLNIHHVYGFTPLEVETGRYGLLVKGKNAEGGWRSYHYVGMSNIVPRLAESDGGKHTV
jgi:hypothetical protein